MIGAIAVVLSSILRFCSVYVRGGVVGVVKSLSEVVGDRVRGVRVGVYVGVVIESS